MVKPLFGKLKHFTIEFHYCNSIMLLFTVIIEVHYLIMIMTLEHGYGDGHDYDYDYGDYGDYGDQYYYYDY